MLDVQDPNYLKLFLAMIILISILCKTDTWTATVTHTFIGPSLTAYAKSPLPS